MATHCETTEELVKSIAATAALPADEARSMPPAIYTDEGLLALEKERIFSHDWLCAGLAAEIPKAGDYMTFSIADQPVVVVRGRDGVIRTLSNVCRHRMMQLLEGRGSTGKIVCPYHAWTYGLDGKLGGAGYMQHTNFDKKTHCLPEYRTEIWHGWVYVTANPDAVPVAEQLKDLDEVVGRYRVEHYVPMEQQDHLWDTNWKLLCENFMEGYHLPVAHKATVGQWIGLDDTWFPEERFESFTYQTFTKSADATYGVAHPDNKHLEDKWRYTSVMPNVFPTHMYVLAPDHVWYLSLRPHGVGQVHVRFGVAIAPEAHAAIPDPEAWTAELVEFFNKVNAEDRFVVEGIFKGAKAPDARPGPLSWLEREIRDFAAYLARRLGDDRIERQEAAE